MLYILYVLFKLAIFLFSNVSQLVKLFMSISYVEIKLSVCIF
jgi:hypothetical protein